MIPDADTLRKLIARLRDHEVSPYHGGCQDCHDVAMDDAAEALEAVLAAQAAPGEDADLIEGLRERAEWTELSDDAREFMRDAADALTRSALHHPVEGPKLLNPAGGTIPSDQGNARRAEPVTGDRPVGSAPTSLARPVEARVTEEYLIWWTNQSDCERITPLDTWPIYLYDQYRCRQGRSGGGRLWVAGDVDKSPAEVKWDASNNWVCRAARDCAGIVIKGVHLDQVQFLPGFVTTFEMALPSLPSPQVTREEIARIVCHYATGPSDANSCCPAPDGQKRCQRKADAIMALFGRAK